MKPVKQFRHPGRQSLQFRLGGTGGPSLGQTLPSPFEFRIFGVPVPSPHVLEREAVGGAQEGRQALDGRADPDARRDLIIGAQVLLPAQQVRQVRQRPADAVQPLLQHIIRARHQVAVLPQPQAMDGFAIDPAVAAQVGHVITVAGFRADEPAALHRPLFGLGQGGGIGIGDDFDIVAAALIVGMDHGADAVFFGNHPGRGQRHPQAGGGRLDLDHVVKLFMPPAPVIRLQNQRVDVPLRCLVGRLLNLPHLGAGGRIAADQMQGAPGQQRGDRAEVGGKHRAAEPRRFEGNRPAAAHRIAHARNVAEASPAQLLHQFRQVAGRGGEVRVDFLPVLRGRTLDLLGAQAVIQLIRIGQPLEGQPLHLFLFSRAEPSGPARFRLAPFVEQPGPLLLFIKQFEQGVLIDQLAFTPPQSGLIHGHDLEKDLPVPLGIAGHRHEQPDQAGPDQHQRLAAPPLADSGQGLTGPRARHAFLVGFGRYPGDGELLFDETEVGHGRGRVGLVGHGSGCSMDSWTRSQDSTRATSTSSRIPSGLPDWAVMSPSISFRAWRYSATVLMAGYGERTSLTEQADQMARVPHPALGRARPAPRLQ